MDKSFLFRGKRYVVGISEIPDDVRNDPALSPLVRARLEAQSQASADDNAHNAAAGDLTQTPRAGNESAKQKSQKKKAEKSK